jgi:pyruvate/2-oxoglutarate dehydrogenase complex dihydrolipoamide dehydrogenase (E3) component
MAALHARKRRIIADFAADRVKQLKSGDFDLIRSNARFLDPHTVELDDGRKVKSRNFLIGTGSRVNVPPYRASQNRASGPATTSSSLISSPAA